MTGWALIAGGLTLLLIGAILGCSKATCALDAEVRRIQQARQVDEERLPKNKAGDE